jgi:hypothetical protein
MMTIETLPENIGQGSFTKPVGKVRPTIELAIESAGERCCKSDRLVRRIGGGYQVWARRANARGVGFPGDYEFLPTGRRAKKRAAGTGRLYIEAV